MKDLPIFYKNKSEFPIGLIDKIIKRIENAQSKFICLTLDLKKEMLISININNITAFKEEEEGGSSITLTLDSIGGVFHVVKVKESFEEIVNSIASVRGD